MLRILGAGKISPAAHPPFPFHNGFGYGLLMGEEGHTTGEQQVEQRAGKEYKYARGVYSISNENFDYCSVSFVSIISKSGN